MELVSGYFTRTRKGHTLMSQAWILEQLAGPWHKLKIARSTLNYNLKILRREGLIETVTRHKRDPKTGHFTCQVTLYKMTKKLRKFLYKTAGWFKRIGWVPDLKALKNGYQPVVGAATTAEDVVKSIRQQRREREKLERRRRRWG